MENKKKINVLLLIILIVIVLIAIGVAYFVSKNQDDDVKILSVDNYTKCTKDNPCTFKVDDEDYNIVYEKKDSDSCENNDCEIIYLNDKEIRKVKNSFGDVSSIKLFKDLLIFETHFGTDIRNHSVEIYNLSGDVLRKISELEDVSGMEVSNDFSGMDADYVKIEEDKLILTGTRRYHGDTSVYDGSYIGLCSNVSKENSNDYGDLRLSDLIDKGILKITDPLTAKYEITYDEILNNDKPRLKEVIETYKYYELKNCNKS